MRHLFENSWRSLGSLCLQILLQVPRVISKTEIWYLGGVGEFGVPSPQVSTPASFSLLWLILVSDHRANQSKINYQGSVCDIKQSPESREVRVRFESRCSEARKTHNSAVGPGLSREGPDRVSASSTHLFFFADCLFVCLFKLLTLLFNYSCLHFPHTLPPPQPNPPPSLVSTLSLGFVHVSFIVVPEKSSPHCPLPSFLCLLFNCS